jgi:hypothetical protein
MAYTVKDVLDELFKDADHIMQQFGDKFTLKQFLQTVSQEKQARYIELLYRCKDDTSPFNAAHRHFGQKLSEVAQKAGYNRIEDGYVEDIFGNRTRNVIYRKP